MDSKLALLVLKFGGTSVADIDRIRNAAAHVKREVDAGHACAVVVSAMAGQTNQLVAWVEQAWGVAERRGQGDDVSVQYDCKEYDAVVASGEQVTSGLLAIVLQSIGVRARSWQGWQIPLMTDDAHRAARIKGVAIDELKARAALGRGCGGRRLPGRWAREPHLDLRPRRLGYERGCACGGAQR